jgi:ubiquinone/menaquinone biosynthesis C-methylase UbiE
METEGTPDIYDPLFVKGVFDRASVAYRYWSQIASFGFIFLWRRQCVDHMPTIPFDGAIGLDLMAGYRRGVALSPEKAGEHRVDHRGRHLNRNDPARC